MKSLKKILIPNEFQQLFDPQYRYFCVHGGRGSLKSHTVARRLLIASREKQVRILCTRELQKSIQDSVHKLLSDLIAEYEMNDFEVMKQGIINKVNGSEFIFTGIRNNTAEIKSMEGIDYCWCEEAQSLTEQSIDILTPTIRKVGSQIIFTYNRFNELDPVHKKFVIDKNPDTCEIKVNYTLAQKYGWFPDVLEKEMEADKTNDNLFNWKWLGEPLSQSDFAIVSRNAVLQSMNRTTEDDGKVIVGVDVARMGNDRTVFYKRKGFRSLDYQVLEHKRTTEVCDLLEKFIDFDKSVEVRVDDTGVGGGVTDEMIKRDYEVLPVNFGGKANDEDKYPNWISEAWFEFAEKINDIDLIYDADLLMELSTRQWKQDIRGKRKIESKQDYKKRGFRSPDIADAVIICFADNPDGYIGDEDIAL